MRFVVVLDLDERVVTPRCRALLLSTHRINGLQAAGPDLPSTLVAVAEAVIAAEQHNSTIDAIDNADEDD